MANMAKLTFYANAKRATAVRIHKFEDGNFVPYWIGRLNGKNVTMKAEWKHKEREQAVEDARCFRQSCRDDLERLSQ